MKTGVVLSVTQEVGNGVIVEIASQGSIQKYYACTQDGSTALSYLYVQEKGKTLENEVVIFENRGDDLVAIKLLEEDD